MLEVAIWIGVVVSGLAALGLVEYLRANSFVKTHRGAILAALPIAALSLLAFVAAAIAMLFFFLFFLADFWEYGLIAIGAIFVFLMTRFRKENLFSGLLVRPMPAAAGPLTPGGRLRRAAAFAVTASGAALLMAFMIPFAATGFILFRFLRILADSMGLAYFVLAALVVAGAALLLYRRIARRRGPPS